MRTAETVLGIIRERGRRGLPLEDVYRQLFNPDLYLQAYGRISRNRGAMTPGVTAETTDGMSLEKIQDIIERLRSERYRWTPVRRTYIDKKGSMKKRPLGIPTWSDRLLQEVIRSVLEAYYEPQFSRSSHGFRPTRGCHTALREIHHVWQGTVWFIEGDVTACFDSLDHDVMLSILREQIHDNRFLRLIENLLKAGYLEEWRYHNTHSGTPQGGVVSPILSNIYLDRLDKWVEQTLLPAYNRGEARHPNPAYERISECIRGLKRTERLQEARVLHRARRRLPAGDPNDPTYRRLRYVRYADDFLLGFAGPKHEAEEIKARIGAFLRDSLKLTLSETKTVVTHARTEAARFLGYDITTLQVNDRLDRRGRRSANGIPALQVPRDVVLAKCKLHMHNAKPIHRTELLSESEYSIVVKFQQEYRGLAEYYRLAYNRSTRLARLQWIMDCALTKTLAHKLRISVSKVWARYGTMIQTVDGPRKVLQVVEPRAGKTPLIAQWGGISLKRQPGAPLLDQVDRRPRRAENTELLTRLKADACEMCGSTERIRVHHIRHLKDLKRPGRPEQPLWARTMAARRRKTLVVCHNCHTGIHAGDPKRTKRGTGEPYDAKVSRTVRRGAEGKGATDG